MSALIPLWRWQRWQKRRRRLWRQHLVAVFVPLWVCGPSHRPSLLCTLVSFYAQQTQKFSESTKLSRPESLKHSNPGPSSISTLEGLKHNCGIFSRTRASAGKETPIQPLFCCGTSSRQKTLRASLLPLDYLKTSRPLSASSLPWVVWRQLAPNSRYSPKSPIRNVGIDLSCLMSVHFPWN